MAQRKARASQDEPGQKVYEKPSEKEHLFQVVDVYDIDNNEYNFDLGPDDVSVKCEVVGGKEESRSILMRLSLDDTWKGFFATRLFLKSISEQYKGEEFSIDSDNWIGKQFYATIEHNTAKNGKEYANIKEYNFEKLVEQAVHPTTDSGKEKSEAEKAWDE